MVLPAKWMSKIVETLQELGGAMKLVKLLLDGHFKYLQISSNPSILPTVSLYHLGHLPTFPVTGPETLGQWKYNWNRKGASRRSPNTNSAVDSWSASLNTWSPARRQWLQRKSFRRLLGKARKKHIFEICVEVIVDGYQGFLEIIYIYIYTYIHINRVYFVAL